MTTLTKPEMEAAVKRLRHQIGVSEQNYRYTGRAAHRAKADACRAALRALLATTEAAR